MESLSMRIGAEWRPGRKTFPSYDPYTGEAWIQAPDAEEQDVADAVAAARRAFDEGPWPRMSGVERAGYLRQLASLLEASADELALCETRDNGKLLKEMRDQLRSLPAFYRYFADIADKIDGRVVDTGRGNFVGLVLREPLGVVAAILPWNSPIQLMTFKIAAALAVGCTVVVKPSEVAPTGILKFAELTEQAGFPPGVFNTVSGLGKDSGQWLASSPGVDKVAFTGSGEVGRKIAAQAAKHLAPVSLELGAKSANIVFADSNIDAAVSGLLSGIFAAAGQSCVAGSRALIQRSVAGEVLTQLVSRTGEILMGDPKDPATQMGPIAFPAHLDRITGFMKRALDDGAEVLAGGEVDPARPQFFPPTIVRGLAVDSAICQEEIFGPILSVIEFEDEDEAIRIANATKYGLAAGVWTRDIQRGMRMARRLVAGTVWLNAYRTLGYAMPFGGLRESGYGRDNGIESMSEYLTDKAVWIETTGAVRDPFTVG